MRNIVAVCFILLVHSCSSERQREGAPVDGQDNTPFMQLTDLASLPDSLQPQTVWQDSMAKPRMIRVPERSGGYYSAIDWKGEVTRIKLEPPVKKMLPVLMNALGEPIKDSNGKTFVMGNGGLSSFTSFTTEDGLSDEVIFYSLTDRTGNIWFATLGAGVSRYDGKSFTRFTTAQGLGDNSTWSILEDRQGHIWFGTAGGASRYDGKVMSTYTKAQGLAGNQVASMAEDEQGIIWFGTLRDGISRFDPSALGTPGAKAFTNFTTADGLASNRVHDIAVDKKGNVWVATDGSGVSRYSPTGVNAGAGVFTSFTTADGLGNNTVLCVRADRQGAVWFGTDGGGATRFDGKTFRTFTTKDGLANNHVLRIYGDITGGVWFCTMGGGVSFYDPSASDEKSRKPFTSFGTEQGLASNRVLSVTEDKRGNMWFGTDGAGVSRYEGRSVTCYTSAQGLANNIVLSMVEDNAGVLWFGTNAGGGLSRYDGTSFTTYTTAQGLAGNTILSMAKDKKGNVWLGTVSGVSRLNLSGSDGKHESFTSFTTEQGWPAAAVIGITEDRQGNLWFGTNGSGVGRYDGKCLTLFTTRQGLSDNSVWSITEDRDGVLWFGTRGGGLCRYDGKTIVSFSVAAGLPDPTITSMVEDKDGNMWLGTYKGLAVLSAENKNKLSEILGGNDDKARKISLSWFANGKMFTVFEREHGLPDSVVTQVLQMPDGRLATGTSGGVMLFRPSPDLKALEQLEIFNPVTGFPIKDVNGGQRCMILDSKGMIWAGTGSGRTGLVRLDLSAIKADAGAPKLVISGVKVNEEPVCWYDLKPDAETVTTDSLTTPANIVEEVSTLGRALPEAMRDSMRQRFAGVRFDSIVPFYPIPNDMSLPYSHNRITIEFHAIETGKPELVSYQYMLEGYDNGWGPVTGNTSATFGNMREGDYTFKLKARGANGKWSEPLGYSFRVLPPWYRTWWAYLAYLLSGFAALRLFSKWQERKLRLENERLEKTVAVRTAEVVAEKKKSDDLLRNILPEEVAEELKMTGATKARLFENVTVLFTDFINFTTAGERMAPQELVDELHTCFRTFDEIVGRYHIEKIKTVGDAYLAAAGLPVEDPTHAEKMVKAGLEIARFMSERSQMLGDKTFHVRVGIHSGPVVAGIVGSKKFAYDIWGDTVNTAARMEQSSEAGKVNISATTYDLVKDKFHCIHRGEVAAKNKGKMNMYYVERVLANVASPLH